MKKITFMFVAFMLTMGIMTVNATNYYVATTGDDANDGLTTSTPFLTPEAAHTVAIDGDVINVDAGTFTLTTGNFNKSVTWQGAGAGLTIIQGSAETASLTNNPNKRFYNKYSGTGNLILKDLTLQNFGYWNSDNGGGTFNLNGSGDINLTMERCNLLNGTCRQAGGIQFMSSGTIALLDCYFSGNVAKPNAVTSKVNNKGNYGYAVLSLFSCSAVIKNCIFNNNNLNDGTSLDTWSVDGTSASPIAINFANSVTSIVFVNNTIVNNGILDKNPERDGEIPTVTTGSVILANSNATTFVAPITKYINNLHLNTGYTDFAVTSTTTAINTDGLLKNNIFVKADSIRTWAADNSISALYTNSSPEINLGSLSTASNGLNYLLATGTDVVGKGLADSDVPTTDIRGIDRVSPPNIGATEYEAANGISVENATKMLVRTFDGKIILSNLNLNDQVNIYNLAGKQIESLKAKSTDISFELTNGVYIVKVGSVVSKIVL